MTRARRFEILPAIDLRGGRVVRLRQGDFERETAYRVDPVSTARTFADAGARWLHVVDLDGAREGRPVQARLIGEIVAAVGNDVRVEVAGGLRSGSAVADVLGLGAARAVLGTAAIGDLAFAGALVALYGADRVAVAIDVRDGQAVGQGWATGTTGLDAGAAIDALRTAGVREFEVTAIERDGLLEGPDLNLYEALLGAGSGSIIASGGIASLDDLRAVRELGVVGAIVGRALYEGHFTLEDALSLS
ncbi:MAG: phosphoribosyl isomerase [Chloroflexota bacterium]|nr:phosphoribosyl isomerase [Chloroflexota bacterium]